jgi:glycosyltransferase 2 family protein
LTEGRSSIAWAVAGRLAVSVALLWLVSRYVDAADVLSRLSELSPGWVAVALAVTVLQVGVLAWRWRYTAARLGIDLPLGRALGEYYLGILLNQVLPGGVAGDVSRAWRHARTDVPAGPAVRAVILERASAQVVMTMAAVASVLVLPWASGAVRATAAVALAAVFGLVLARLVRRPVPASAMGRLWADTRRALLAPDAFATQLASAVLVVASYIVVFLIAARAVDAETPLATMLPLVAPVLMTMLIPVTVAGWGIREAAAAALWGFAGLTPADGAAISVAYGLLVLVSSAPGLLVLTRTVTGSRGRTARPPRA